MKPKLILCLALVGFNFSSYARIVQIPSNAELMVASDLVVVGRPIETKDLDEVNSLGWSSLPATFQFHGVETTFKVSEVLKGTPASDQIVLHHYRETARGSVPNGPDFLEFIPGDTNEYLLYLINDGTNRYAPTFGQIDPALQIKLWPTNSVADTNLTKQIIAISLSSHAAVETNGFLVFEITRITFAGASEIKQKFKVPLTEEFLSNFKHLPNQNSSGTGFCCSGGDGSTRFMWWIRKTTDNRWAINMWGEGVETIDGVTVSSRNPKSSQSQKIKRLEDLDMSYMLSYLNKFDGINISFTAKYVSAEDIKAEGDIPAASVRKADRTELFKGDDLKNHPLEISCLFQEG